MSFFELSSPDYETDEELEAHNPIRLSCEYFIPSVQCEICGAWASSDRIRKNFESSVLKTFRGIKFLSLSDWKAASLDWASELGVSTARITPGAELGKPQAELLSVNIDDFLHPMPGQILMTKKVAAVLEEGNASGVELYPLSPVWGKKVKNVDYDPPILWELVVKGVGWRKGVDEKSIEACDLCGRTIFPQAPILIDQDRWDGSDIFNIDKNPNRVFVTDRIAELIESYGFRNYRLRSVG